MTEARLIEPGDVVDLARDKYADPEGHPFLECEYVVVTEVTHETADCILIGFDEWNPVGFPHSHKLNVRGYYDGYIA
jgi:hypothetical protein